MSIEHALKKNKKGYSYNGAYKINFKMVAQKRINVWEYRISGQANEN